MVAGQIDLFFLCTSVHLTPRWPNNLAEQAKLGLCCRLSDCFKPAFTCVPLSPQMAVALGVSGLALWYVGRVAKKALAELDEEGLEKKPQ